MTTTPSPPSVGDRPDAAGPTTGPTTGPITGPTLGHPSVAPTPPSLGAPRRTGRPALAASVVAASLLVGGAAGVGGAAAWDQWQPAASGGTTLASPRSVSSVADTSDGPVAAGSVVQVARRVLPSVVKIDVAGAQGSGSGSGIILSSDGRILTNHHVVEAAGETGSIRVSFDDGSSAAATVLGTDPLTDTAVLRADDVDGLTPATIGRSSDLQVGQEVVAIGSPFGLESTVTSGIVSALDRPVAVGSDGEGNSTTYPAIQTDAAINPGNSGGPLVDLGGNVVGIDSSIRTTGSTAGGPGGSIGLGFAIPIDDVMPIVDQMSRGEAPTHARLGITVSDVADRTGGEVVEGARVQDVTAGSTAASAGLSAGDVIIRVDDRLISSADSLVATIRSYRPGDRVEVTYRPAGEPASETRTTELRLDSDAPSSRS